MRCRNATKGRQCTLKTFGERFKALRETDHDGFKVRVAQHSMKQHMEKRYPSHRYSQLVHMSEVRLDRLARLMHLFKHHFALWALLTSPRRNSPLQRAQLTGLVTSRRLLLQNSK
jgi:hypothetical protein